METRISQYDDSSFKKLISCPVYNYSESFERRLWNLIILFSLNARRLRIHLLWRSMSSNYQKACKLELIRKMRFSMAISSDKSEIIWRNSQKFYPQLMLFLKHTFESKIYCSNQWTKWINDGGRMLRVYFLPNEYPRVYETQFQWIMKGNYIDVNV